MRCQVQSQLSVAYGDSRNRNMYRGKPDGGLVLGLDVILYRIREGLIFCSLFLLLYDRDKAMSVIMLRTSHTSSSSSIITTGYIQSFQATRKILVCAETIYMYQVSNNQCIQNRCFKAQNQAMNARRHLHECMIFRREACHYLSIHDRPPFFFSTTAPISDPVLRVLLKSQSNANFYSP